MVLAEKGITFKLFAGFLVNAELRMHMRLSPQWKEQEILQKNALNDLKLVHFNDMDYLGIYLERTRITLQEIDSLETRIRKSLKDLFPKYPSDTLNLYLFTQAFIL
jgi:hypothetical protein